MKMNSLMNYGSDENSEESDDEKIQNMEKSSTGLKNTKNCLDEDNYEEVEMDLSEDSNDSSAAKNNHHKSTNHGSEVKKSTSDDYQRKSGSKSPKSRGNDHQRKRSSEESCFRKRGDHRNSRDSKNDRRDRFRDDKKKDRRDERYHRDKRDRRRSRSRGRSRRSSRSPKRSRADSKDRVSRNFSSRREKADKRMDRLGKLGIEFKPDSYPASALEEAELNSKAEDTHHGDKSFMPGVSGRFRDQIEKRKLLWQKAKDPESTALSTPIPKVAPLAPTSSKSTKVYEATTFADDKTSSKFKRLMGIKQSTSTDTDDNLTSVKGTDVLKKQQEMFTSMEAQYEVARTATHTMRGVGLGFGSFQR